MFSSVVEILAAANSSRFWLAPMLARALFSVSTAMVIALDAASDCATDWTLVVASPSDEALMLLSVTVIWSAFALVPVALSTASND